MSKIPEYEVTSVVNGVEVKLIIDGLTGPRPDMIFIVNSPSYGWNNGTRRLAVYTGEAEHAVLTTADTFYTPDSSAASVFLPGWRIL